MKLLRLLTRLTTVPSKSPFRTISQSSWHHNYSTSTTKATPASMLKKSFQNSGEEDTLYRRISPMIASQSIVPVLDQWHQQGGDLNYRSLIIIIRELRHYRRYKHALEISQWMCDKLFTPMTAAAAAVRLDLIAKVHGVQEAENYFNNIPKQIKTLQVYGALLNCFSNAKCVDKAEGVMQKMRELGCASNIMSYNVMFRMYCSTGDQEKIDALIHELEEKQMKLDSYTYSILLNAYGNGSDAEGMERILTKMESDPELDIDWMTYAIAARQFLHAELKDKALQVLRKSEKLVAFTKKKNEAYSFILSLYANAGEKAGVLRVWKKCKTCKVTNKDSMSMLRSVLKFNDIETAEKVFKDWEDSDLLKDIRIPNFLIISYCKIGLMEKAEALIERAKEKNWQKLNAFTWFWMSFGYVKNNRMSKAVEAMESCLLVYHPASTWKPNQEALVPCLKYLKEERNAERFNAIIGLLKDKCIINVKIHEKLFDCLSDECSIEDVFEQEGLDGMTIEEC